MIDQITTIRPHDTQYPLSFQHIIPHPEQLYLRGNHAVLHHPRLIAIVGSRKPTSYGKQVVQRIVPELVRAGFVTVSGLALGIDGLVHQHTIDAGGQTIAILGGSILSNEVYPRAHIGLSKKIIASGGLLLTEYASGIPTYPSNFPERNRLIAGLSLATIVVEATEKSGSLITARLAAEYNKEVFAVPGPLFSPQSQGANALILKGATPLLSCKTVYDQLEYAIEPLITELPPLSSNFGNLDSIQLHILQLLATGSLPLDSIIDETVSPNCSTQQVIAQVQHLRLMGYISDSDGHIMLIH